MFKTTEELKQFILWCKNNKIKTFTTPSASFELSELAFIEHLNESQMEEKTSEAMDTTLIDTAKQELEEEDEKEDLLFWSSN